MKRLTKKEGQVLHEYVRKIARSLRMKDWRFVFHKYAAPPDSFAASISTYGKREHTILFAKGFRKLPVEQVRESVIHELLHAHLQPTWHYLDKTLPLVTSHKATAAFRSACLQREEEAVNDLARAIAPRYPLIKWPK